MNRGATFAVLCVLILVQVSAGTHFRVTITTPWIDWGDTDSTFYYVFKGTKGVTERYLADIPGYNDRSRAQTDVWTFSTGRDIGHFECLYVTIEGDDAWYFNRADIVVDDRDYYTVNHDEGWLDDYNTHWLCLPDDQVTVDGGYSNFGDWSKCSAKCGGGTQTRSRTCTNPAPANGGADCVGDSTESRKCNTQKCLSPAGNGKVKVTAYAVKPTKMVCGLGKWDCKPTFIVRKSKGVVDKNRVKICKLVKGKLKGCEDSRAFPGDKYLLRTGKVMTAGYAGAYVAVYTENGVETVSDPVTVIVN